MLNGLNPEEMGIDPEEMKTPEQREREHLRQVVHEVAVAGYGNLVSDPDRVQKGADYISNGTLTEAENSGVEIPSGYLEGVKDLIAAIREREGLSVTLGKYMIEEVIAAVESGDSAGLYTAMADVGRPFKERGKGIELDAEKDAAIFEAAKKVFESRDASETSTTSLLQFYELFNKYVEQYMKIIEENEKLITEYEQFLNGAEAEEYLASVGYLPVEALLEARGDERTWTELSDDEKVELRQLLSAYAERVGRKLEEDENSCIVT